MIDKARETVVVGMSGGVDSSVSAYLLKSKGYCVQGVFMKNWEQDDTELYCHSAQDVYDAKQVADTLDIPLSSVNFAQIYWDRVFQHFLSEYKAGRTPNPDVLCNKEIKFQAFLKHAQTLGANRMATGHYARVVEGPQGFELHKSADLSKDQSYFLHLLNQQQLSHTLFPLADITKKEVRALAQQLGLATAEKKDSTGICFIGERKFKTFLEQYLPAQPGPITTLEGKIIGEHAGLMYYTLGQRQGLNIGGVQHAEEAPWFVASKHLPSNRLVVVQGHDHPALFTPSCIVHEIHWITQPPEFSETLYCKTRYRQADTPCRITPFNDHYQIAFDTPQRAVTPGQSIVFYKGTQCLGGGMIESLAHTQG